MTLTPTQLIALKYLCQVAINQKAHARQTHTKFQQGWFSNEGEWKSATIKRLLADGLIEQRDVGKGSASTQIRISRAGVIYLEDLNGGETILA